jgi:hypothetical protein
MTEDDDFEGTGEKAAVAYLKAGYYSGTRVERQRIAGI